MPQLGDEYKFGPNETRSWEWSQMSRAEGNDYTADRWDNLFKRTCQDLDIFCFKTNRQRGSSTREQLIEDSTREADARGIRIEIRADESRVCFICQGEVE